MWFFILIAILAIILLIFVVFRLIKFKKQSSIPTPEPQTSSLDDDEDKYHIKEEEIEPHEENDKEPPNN